MNALNLRVTRDRYLIKITRGRKLRLGVYIKKIV